MPTIKGLSCGTVLVALGLAGCANVPREAGFDQVQRDVQERVGQRIVWDRGTEADAQVREHVRALLDRPLNADSATQIALLNNRQLQATYEDLMVAQADLVGAGLLRNPIFDAEVKFAEGGGGTNLDLAVVFEFLDVLFIPARKRLAASAFDQAKLRVAGAAVELAGRVRQALYSAQAMEQRLELRRTVLEAAEAGHLFAQRLHAAGNITDLDLAHERAAHEQAKLDVASTEMQVKQSRERLNVLMGLWGNDTQWKLDARLPEPPREEVAIDRIESKAVEKSLELAVQRRELTTAAQRLGLSRSMGLLSEGEVGIAAEREAEGDWALGPAFSVPIPLLNQGQPAVAAAQAELRRSQNQLVATAVEVRSKARVARDRLLAARDRATYLRSVMLPLRRQITEQTQRQANAMQVSAFQLLAAKQQEIETGVQYIDALEEYWQARAALALILSGGAASSESFITTSSPGMGSSPSREGH